MATKTWSLDADFSSAEVNIDASGDAVQFGYGDEFTNAQNLMTGGDAGKANNWALANSATLSTADIDTTTAGSLVWVQNAVGIWETLSVGGPHLYKTMSGDKNWDIEIEFAGSTPVVPGVGTDEEGVGLAVKWLVPPSGGSHNTSISWWTLLWGGIAATTRTRSRVSKNGALFNNSYVNGTHNYLRLVKAGSVFTAYCKTLVGDAWTQVYTFTDANYNHQGVVAQIGPASVLKGTVVAFTFTSTYFRATTTAGQGTVLTSAFSNAAAQVFDFAALAATTSNTGAGDFILYDYKLETAAGVWGDWQGSYKTLTQLQELGLVKAFGIQFRMLFVGSGGSTNVTLSDLAIDYVAADAVAPADPTNVKYKKINSDADYALRWTPSVATDVDYHEVKVVVDGTDKYVKSDGSVAITETGVMEFMSPASTNSNVRTPDSGWVTIAPGGTTVTLWVKAVDGSGNSSNWVEATEESSGDTTATDHPLLTVADAESGGRANFTIVAPTDSDYSSTAIYRQGGDGAFDQFATSVAGATLTSFETGLSNNTFYTYIAQSRDTTGNWSKPSNEQHVLITDGTGVEFITELAAYLATNNIGTVGTNIFKDFQPDSPDACVTVIDEGGDETNPHDFIRAENITFLVRSTTYALAEAKIQSIYALFEAKTNISLTHWKILTIGQGNQPAGLGQDERRRWEMSVTYRFRIHRKG